MKIFLYWPGANFYIKKGHFPYFTVNGSLIFLFVEKRSPRTLVKLTNFLGISKCFLLLVKFEREEEKLKEK